MAEDHPGKLLRGNLLEILQSDRTAEETLEWMTSADGSQVFDNFEKLFTLLCLFTCRFPGHTKMKIVFTEISRVSSDPDKILLWLQTHFPTEGSSAVEIRRKPVEEEEASEQQPPEIASVVLCNAVFFELPNLRKDKRRTRIDWESSDSGLRRKIVAQILQFFAAFHGCLLEVEMAAEFAPLPVMQSTSSPPSEKKTPGEISIDAFATPRVFREVLSTGRDLTDRIVALQTGFAARFLAGSDKEAKGKNTTTHRDPLSMLTKEKKVIKTLDDIEELPPCLLAAQKKGSLKDPEKRLVFWTLNHFAQSADHLAFLAMPFVRNSQSPKLVLAQNCQRAFTKKYNFTCNTACEENICPMASARKAKIKTCGGCSSPADFINRQLSVITEEQSGESGSEDT